MIYLFDDFELDSSNMELSKSGESISVEPKVFDLLCALVANSGDLVSKDQLIEDIWQGRVISDSAVSTCIKAARQALGDDGNTQKYIKTVHGRGFRFNTTVTSKQTSASTPEVIELNETAQSSEIYLGDPRIPHPVADAGRPSIAILPLHLIGPPNPLDTLADALPHELITELSRLRWLFVIARGSSFRFRDVNTDVTEVGKALSVKYCLSGSVEITDNSMNLHIELANTVDGGVVWADRIMTQLKEFQEVRSSIVSSIVASLEVQITANEASRAELHSTDDLNAWSAYHLGLKHMFRFTNQDNQKAMQYFETALSRDSNFARAHAGKSFTHFQNAFLNYTADREKEKMLAYQFAEKGMELEPLDPFINLTQGRSFWLDADLEQSRSWLSRTTELSPSYAHGIYSLAWTNTMSGRSEVGQSDAERAALLSPLDPLLYAMFGTQAFAHMIRGEDEQGAILAEKAANSPGAHALIAMIAVAANVLSGNVERATQWSEKLRRTNPNITQHDFFQSFPFTDPDTRSRISAALSTQQF